MPLMGSLYIGQSGLQTSQNALNTTAHNMSNSDTVGYVRQQVLLGTSIYNTIKTDVHAVSNQQIGHGVEYSKNPNGVIYLTNGTTGSATRGPENYDKALFKYATASKMATWSEISIDGDTSIVYRDKMQLNATYERNLDLMDKYFIPISFLE